MEVTTAPDFPFVKDPRLSNVIECRVWFIATLLASYLYMVRVWGPNFMRHRKAYDLRNVTRVYNVFQVVASVYFAVRMFHHFYFRMGKSLMCAPPDRTPDADNMKLLELGYYYFYLRVSDFLDTLFFILRKKDRQVTFLHVFHHVAVVFFIWFTSYFGLGNLVIFSGTLNSLVHAIMYSYYFLSTLGPSVQPYLWWKRHLTKLQIAQFFVILAHISVPMFTDCGYPRLLISSWLACVIIILILFINFYIRNYFPKSKQD